jgi:colanic acid/amylovoran biosynthesis glycosyltransferase
MNQRAETDRKERPHVVVVATTLPARPGDGTPEFVLTLARSLRDHDVTVVAPRMPDSARHEVVDGVTIRRVAYFPRRWEGLASDAIMPTLRAQPWRIVEAPCLILALLFATLRVVRREKAAVLNPHWIVPGGLITWLVSRMTRVPYVLTVHGADAYTLTGKATRWVKRPVLKRAAAVLPVSDDISRTLGLPEGTPVLRMGVDTEALATEVGERRPEPGLLVAVGRLADKKGLDVLLRAMAVTSGTRLEVVGDGPERPALEQLTTELDLTDRVTFAGRQPRSGVLDALARAEAVVIPSKVGAGGDKDGTPVVLCEAMAAGVPVVASALGGLAECLEDGETGLLVPPDDVDALARALARLTDGSVDLGAMGEAARAEAKRSLDINAIGARYDEILSAATTR